MTTTTTATWALSGARRWADAVDDPDYNRLPWDVEDSDRPREEAAAAPYSLEEALEETPPVEAPPAPAESVASEPPPRPDWPTPAESAALEGPPASLDETPCVGPPAEVYWWTPVSIPKSTALIFHDPVLYAAICDFCRNMENFAVDDKNRVVRTLCNSCRTVMSQHELNRCQGAYAACKGARYVDEVGTIAPLCRGCHQFEENTRRQRREGQRHHARRGCQSIRV
jgi:hypothetical protein